MAHLEDIAEELVGVIHDEDDILEPSVEREPGGAWLVPGRWRIDEIVDATGVPLPEEDDYDTASGLVIQQLGRIPMVGDRMQVGDTLIEVITMGRHVPVTLRLVRSSTGPLPEEHP